MAETPKFYPLTIPCIDADKQTAAASNNQLTLYVDRFRLEIGDEFEGDSLRKVIHVLESLSK